MKKTLMFLLAFLMMILSACGSNSAESSKNSFNLDIVETATLQEYLFIKINDLDNHCGQIVGSKILTVGKVGDIKSTSGEDYIQISVPDTYHYDSFYLASNSVVDPHDYKDKVIAIIGVVTEQTNALFFTSAKVTDCYVIAYGDDAEQYNTDTTDYALLSKFSLVDKEIGNLSEEEYKSNCVKYGSQNYEDIMRNPDKYKGNLMSMSGKVDQIIDGFFDSITIYVLDNAGNKWELSYTYKEGESHVLEGDNITVWGESEGTTHSTTVLGKQMTLPSIKCKYID